MLNMKNEHLRHKTTASQKVEFFRIIALLSILLFLISSSSLHAQARLIVKLKPESISQAAQWQTSVQSMSDKYGLVSEPIFKKTENSVSQGIDGFDRSRYLSVILPDSSRVNELTSELENNDAVEWVEIDHKLELYEVPNDSLFKYQWFHQNLGQEYYGIQRNPGANDDSLLMKHGKAGADIGTVPARDKTDTQVRPLVVIIDTGLDWKHPDIAANLWINPDEIPENGIDDDHNGFIDDVHGWDFSGDTIQFFNLQGDNDPMDQHGHGTHVSGIAGAVSNNSIGVAGVASDPEVIGLKIFPNAFTSIGMRAIMYATDMGADVINMSWGNYYRSQGLEDILEYAHSRNVVLVAAIGNFGDSTATYPARFSSTIAVGGTDSEDHITYFSSFGSWMDLAAPGLDILSLRADTLDMYAEQYEPEVRIIDSNYYLADGTSMSSPMVAGAAAEIRSYAPGISPDSVRAILRASADDIIDPYDDGSNMPGFDVFSGYGRLNVNSALKLVGGRLAKINYPLPKSLIDGPLEIRGTAFSQFGDNYELYIAPASDTLNKTLIAGGPANILNDHIADYNGLTVSGKYWLFLNIGNDVYRREIYYTAEPEIAIKSPMDGDTVKGALNFRGTVVAPGFQECNVTMYPAGQSRDEKTIITTTGYVADSLIGTYLLAHIPEGEYIFNVVMLTSKGEFEQSLHLFISNGFSRGFPVHGKGLLDYGPAVYDMDGNGRLEAVVSSRKGVGAYNHMGGYVPGIWRNASDLGTCGPPAVYDINNDGRGEVAFVSENQLNLLSFDGYPMPGFPKKIPTSEGQNGYPTVFFADMDNDGYQEIIYVSMRGEIFAYRHDGTSYFASLDGYFGEAPGMMYEHVPFVFVNDFNRDGQKEMIVVMRDAISIFNTHNGIEPDWLPDTKIAKLSGISGACMADFDGDSMLELAVIGRESENEQIYVAMMEPDGTYLDGFPKYLDRINYLINYPAAADLDGDGKAEIIFDISAVDNAEVWIVRSDGSTVSSIGGQTDNWFASIMGTAAPPAVADVDGDGSLDIIVRQGNFFPGRVSEEIYAFNQDGQVLDGWPVFTFTNPNAVIYRLHTPTITNLGEGEHALFADLLIPADDSSIYAWELPVEFDKQQVAWGEFMHDSRHTGILPPEHGIESPGPPQSGNSQPAPAGFYLSQNYPNPFNASTQINFRLMKSSDVKLEIYNILGQKVRSVIDENMASGEHHVIWDGRNDSGEPVSSGIYFYRLQTNFGVISRKMTILK